MAVTDQQTIISGVPQGPGEINVMDYYGAQAGAPVLQPETQLAPQVQEQTVQTGEIQVAPTVATSGIQVATPTAPAAAQIQTQAQPVAYTAQYTGAQAPVVQGAVLTTAETAKDQLETTEAATAEPSEEATVRGQMANLMEDFDVSNPPAWAAGAMRSANAILASRGLSASSMAGAALVQAAMESALPIASADAATRAQFEMANLSNEQQALMFDAQARMQAIFNDTAAQNTANNINAQAENEVSTFYANLTSQVEQFNAAQQNTMSQFNTTAMNQAKQFAEELNVSVEKFNAQEINDRAEFNASMLNSVNQFNATMENNREQFNVQNQVAIDASNVQWRRDINTANTAAANAAMQFDVQNLLGIQNTSLNNIWNHYDSMLSYAFQAEENAANRANSFLIASMTQEMQKQIAEDQNTGGLISGIVEAGIGFLGTDTGGSFLDKWF